MLQGKSCPCLPARSPDRRVTLSHRSPGPRTLICASVPRDADSAENAGPRNSMVRRPSDVPADEMPAAAWEPLTGKRERPGSSAMGLAEYDREGAR